MKFFSKNTEEATTTGVDSGSDNNYPDPLADLQKSRWDRLWPVMACGAGLFSDGYINNVNPNAPSLLGIILTSSGYWFRLYHAWFHRALWGRV